MGTTTQRILALGGAPQWSQFERHQTAPHLPWVLLTAFSVALILSTLMSQLLKGKHDELLPLRHPGPTQSIVAWSQYTLATLSGGPETIRKPQIMRKTHSIPIPVADAELFDEGRVRICHECLGCIQ